MKYRENLSLIALFQILLLLLFGKKLQVYTHLS